MRVLFPSNNTQETKEARYYINKTMRMMVWRRQAATATGTRACYDMRRAGGTRARDKIDNRQVYHRALLPSFFFLHKMTVTRAKERADVRKDKENQTHSSALCVQRKAHVRRRKRCTYGEKSYKKKRRHMFSSITGAPRNAAAVGVRCLYACSDIKEGRSPRQRASRQYIRCWNA